MLFRGHLNKVKGSARMDRGHKDTYCLGPWEQNIRKAHHLGFVRIYYVLYLDHQLSHRVINCYCSYNVCRNLTTTIKIGHKFRHQYQWQALTWGHRPKQKTKFSLQEYKKWTGIRISKVIQWSLYFDQFHWPWDCSKVVAQELAKCKIYTWRKITMDAIGVD